MRLTSIEKEKEKEKNNIRLKEILKTIKEWLKDLKNGTVEELEIKEQNSVVLHVKFESDDNLDRKMMQFQYLLFFYMMLMFLRFQLTIILISLIQRGLKLCQGKTK